MLTSMKIFALALALGFGLIVPLLRLNSRRAAREADPNLQVQCVRAPPGR